MRSRAYELVEMESGFKVLQIWRGIDDLWLDRRNGWARPLVERLVDLMNDAHGSATDNTAQAVLDLAEAADQIEDLQDDIGALKLVNDELRDRNSDLLDDVRGLKSQIDRMNAEAI